LDERDFDWTTADRGWTRQKMPKKLSSRELMRDSVEDYELEEGSNTAPAVNTILEISQAEHGSQEEEESLQSSNSLAQTVENLVQYRAMLVLKIIQRSTEIKYCFQLILFVLFNYYLFLVWDKSPSDALWLIPVSYFIVTVWFLNTFSARIFELSKKHLPVTKGDLSGCRDFVKTAWQYGLLVVIWLFIVYVIVTACLRDSSVVIPLSGLVFLVTICFILSTSPVHVKASTILWGLAFQFILAYLIARTDFGHALFFRISQWAKGFFNYASFGSEFVFGHLYSPSQFVFAIHASVLIIFLNSVVAILYYLGIMQFIIQSIAKLLKATLGTSAPETVSAAANIFLGQVESPMVILPYLNKLTLSELHAVMCGGFATISGAVLGIYLGMGLPTTHLLAASVLNAPASLLFAKLVYPDNPRDVHKSVEHVNLSKSKEKNIVEAAANGACAAVPICLNISANLIAFISLLAFVNTTISYFGGLVGYPVVNLETILAYVFYPFAMILGLDEEDTFKVAELMGTKTIVNEFVAFIQLADLIKKNAISERAAALATYCICNFANISSLGIQLGGIGALVVDRKADLAKVGVSALICGSIAPLSNACIMAILYESPHVLELALNSTITP
jgi:nucleoside transporter